MSVQYHIKTMDELYRHAETEGFSRRRVDRLVEQFEIAAKFLAHKIDTEGWMWRDNFMRKYAGCSLHASFTNTVSPFFLSLR